MVLIKSLDQNIIKAINLALMPFRNARPFAFIGGKLVKLNKFSSACQLAGKHSNILYCLDYLNFYYAYPSRRDSLRLYAMSVANIQNEK
jgi:hypothetical protein